MSPSKMVPYVADGQTVIVTTSLSGLTFCQVINRNTDIHKQQYIISIAVGKRGGTGGTCPTRFRNKQRSVLYFQEMSLYLQEEKNPCSVVSSQV